MIFQNYPYFYLFFLSAVLSGAIAYYSWTRREIPSAKVFSILMALVAAWTFLYGCEVVTDIPELHLLFLNLEYLVIPWISGTVVVYSLIFGGYNQYLSKRAVILIYLIPAIIFVGYYTNNLHHLFYPESSFQVVNHVLVISNTHGILYDLLTYANILSVFFCSLVLLHVFLQSPPTRRSQIILALVAAILLLFCIFGRYSIPPELSDFDLIPVFLPAIGVLLLVAIFRYQYFDLVHIPYQSLFSYLNGGVLVLDPKNCVLELNGEMEQLLGEQSSVLRGLPLGARDSPLLEHLADLTGQKRSIFEICKRSGSSEQFFRIEMNPVRTEKGRILCRMVTSYDITDRVTMHQALCKAGKKLDLLNTITRHDILNQVTIIEGCSDLLTSTVGVTAPSRYLVTLRSAAETIAHLIQFTAAYQYLGVDHPDWQHVPTVARTAWKALHPPQDCRLEVRCDLTIYADMLLEKVFFNLFDNSFRHGGDIRQVTISAEERDERTILVYEDDGCGVEPAVKGKIFGKGFGKNTGYGLFLIAEILSITGISIVENGRYGQGVRFEMTIPKEGVR